MEENYICFYREKEHLLLSLDSVIRITSDNDEQFTKLDSELVIDYRSEIKNNNIVILVSINNNVVGLLVDGILGIEKLNDYIIFSLPELLDCDATRHIKYFAVNKEKRLISKIISLDKEG